MRVSVKGIYKNLPVTVVWEDGKLLAAKDTDLFAVRRVKAEAEVQEGRDVGVVGQYTRKNHLSSALSTVELIRSVLDRVDEVTGDVPVAETLPDGAIG